VNITITDFLDVISCSLADKYQCFGSTPKLKATISSGTLVPIHQTIWHSFPENYDIYNYEGMCGLHTYTTLYISREKDEELFYLIFKGLRSLEKNSLVFMFT
jgi:hypothetical protein